MTRILTVALLTVLCISPGCSLRKGTAKTRPAVGSRPNIVFMFADDMGWADPGFNGGNPELTPHIDRLRTQGMSLTQFYTHSVCAPSRAAFLTGRYAFRTWSDWRSDPVPASLISIRPRLRR